MSRLIRFRLMNCLMKECHRMLTTLSTVRIMRIRRRLLKGSLAQMDSFMGL